MLRKKLILHVGLPKTGTSALQAWCAANRQSLLSRGINYPDTGHPHENKHQFLVAELLRERQEKLRTVLAAHDQGLLLLSAEGLTNHLYDFTANALDLFRRATADFHTTIFMVTRETNRWSRSYYKQALLNPPSRQYHYATPLRYEEFCNLDRIRKLADVSTLERDVETAYGASEVSVARYENDWMGAFLRLLGIEDDHGLTKLPQVHRSISDDMAELVRQVNAMQLANSDRAAFLGVMQASMKTDHIGLMQWYKPSMSRTNTMILSRLSASTPGQSELIERLSNWLKGKSEPPERRAVRPLAASPLEWDDTDR